MKRKILLVEDDDSLRETLTVSLSQEFDVVAAGTGAEALELCRTHQPAVIVIDFSLPDMDASEVCHQVEADPAYGTPKVIVMTGKYDETSSINYNEKVSKAFVVDAYFNKPFETEALINRIKQFRVP